MTSALRWAAMTAILMFHNCAGQNHTRQCPQTTTFQVKGELKQIQIKVPLLTSLNALPLGQTGSHLWFLMTTPPLSQFWCFNFCIFFLWWPLTSLSLKNWFSWLWVGFCFHFQFQLYKFLPRLVCFKIHCVLNNQIIPETNISMKALNRTQNNKQTFTTKSSK